MAQHLEYLRDRVVQDARFPEPVGALGADWMFQYDHAHIWQSECTRLGSRQGLEHVTSNEDARRA